MKIMIQLDNYVYMKGVVLVSNNHECIVCNQLFEEKYFDFEQQKCILHCDKHEHNSWYVSDPEVNTKKWNEKKIKKFWGYIKKGLKRADFIHKHDNNIIRDPYVFENVIFPKFQQDIPYCEHAMNYEDQGTNFFCNIEQSEENPYGVSHIFNLLNLVFDTCTFLDEAPFERYSWQNNVQFNACRFCHGIELPKNYMKNISFLKCDFQKHSLDLKDSTFEENLEILECFNLQNLYLTESTITGKAKIQLITIEDQADFFNTKFMDLADFYGVTFNEVNFTKTDFNDIAVFSEAKFIKDIDFKYTKFLNEAIFRDTVFYEKLDLRNAIFKTGATILDITSEKGSKRKIKVANRETARIIKSLLDSSKNIIEANKYYALEMKEREKELKKTKQPREWLEWLIFKIHGVSSNHSQDWFLAVLWILVVGIINYAITMEQVQYTDDFLVLSSTFLVPLLYLIICNENIEKPHYKYGILLFIIAIPLSFSIISLGELIKTVNAFSKLGQDISAIEFLFHLITAYLLYQFAVSVRQNTRRK